MKGVNSKGSITKSERDKHNKKTLQEIHNEYLKNIMSSNIVKPTNVEAQRILKILDELVENVEILSYIDEDFNKQFLPSKSAILSNK